MTAVGLLIITIECGFYLKERVPGAVPLFSGLLLGSIALLIGLHAAKGRFSGTRRFAVVAVLLLLASAGSLFGAIRHQIVPTTDPFVLGTGVQLKATVIRVQQLSAGEEIVLHVDQISSVAEPGFLRVSFQVEWMVWQVNIPAHVGANYMLTGVLAEPPVASESGVPVRSKLRALGIKYEFQGHAARRLAASANTRQVVFSFLSDAVNRTGKVSRSDNALLESIVFGDGSQSVAPQAKQWFLRAGLLHVLAASGANVFIMEWFFQVVMWPVRRQHWVRISPRVFILVSVGFLWSFAWMCGFQASIDRAALMASYRNIAVAVGRESSSWNALLFAGLIMTVLQPATLFTPSSVLSFAATAAVQTAVYSLYRGTGVKKLQARSSLARGSLYLASRLVSVLKASLFVEAFLFPLVLYWFRQITPFSILANLVAEPLLGVLLPLTAIFMLISTIAAVTHALIFSLLAKAAAVCTSVLLHLLLRVTHVIGVMPQSLYTTSPVLLVDVLSYYVAIFGVVYLAKKISKYANM